MSLIAWMDTSADEQRRVREIVALFADNGTLDELGIGQIREAFSNCVFPRTPTTRTRARWMTFGQSRPKGLIELMAAGSGEQECGSSPAGPSWPISGWLRVTVTPPAPLSVRGADTNPVSEVKYP